jgi:TolB-like protein
MGGAPNIPDHSDDATSPAPEKPASEMDGVVSSPGGGAPGDDLGQLWQRIREHKIIQWGVGYLAAALALTHSEELIAHAFDWPEFVSRALIIALALGLPLALVLAWYHGHRASRHVSGAEASIIAILLLMSSGILWLFVQPHESAVSPRLGLDHRLSASVSASTDTANIAVVQSRASSGPGTQPDPTSIKPRIAILPFENLSPDPNNAFFTDGLHEEILATLSQRAPGLEVISRTTMMLYRTTPKSVEEIARELGATHVLEGSVRREGNVVRLTLQLIDARSDEHLWAQDYDRTLKSALALQSEVANEVASQLSVQLAEGADAFRPPTQDPQAYDLYLKANLEMDSSTTRRIGTPIEALQQVNKLLDAALVRDPSFAAARAMRASLSVVQFLYNYDTDERALRRAQEDLKAAERLAPNDPTVLFSKGLFLYIDRDLNGSIAAQDAAAAAGLADSSLLASSSEALVMSGRLDEAIQRVQRARALDPKNSFVYDALIEALIAARRPAEALRIASFAAAQFPERFTGAKAFIEWQFTGSPSAMSAWPSAIPRTPITAASDASSLNSLLARLRYQHRYRDMAELLGRATTKTMRSGAFAWGEQPVAEQWGWVHLLLGDRTAAAQDGREVLDFVAHRKETQWNRAFLHLLTAEGSAFAGDRERAIAAAHETLTLADWPYDRQQVSPIVARVYAWYGAGDEATTLLEQLSTGIPMTIAPSEIARDPLYEIPLAGDARYQALKAKIEAQMAATNLD